MAAADEQLPSVNKPEESDAVSQAKNNDGKASASEAEKEETEPTEEPVTARNGCSGPNEEHLESSSGGEEASAQSISIPESQLSDKMDVDEVNGDRESEQGDLDAKAASPDPAALVESMESDSGENKTNSSEVPAPKTEPCPSPPSQAEPTQGELVAKEDATTPEVDGGTCPSPKPDAELDSPVKSAEEASDDISIVKVTKDEANNGMAAKSRRKDPTPESLLENSEDGAMDNQGRRRSLRIRSSSSKKYTEADAGEDDADCIPLDSPTPSPAKDPLMLSKKALIVPAKPSKPTFRVGDIPLPKSISMTPVSLKKEPTIASQGALHSTSANAGHSGFVIIDTTSLLAGKGPVAVSSLTPSPATPPVVLNPPQNPVRLLSSSKTPSSRTKMPAISPASTSATSLCGSSSNATADLFAKHGLTDDSYIVEAPSFIVPYIIEKSGDKSLKKFLDTEKETKDEDGAKKKKKEQPPAKKNEKKGGDVIMLSEGEEEEEDEEEEDEEREEDSSESDAHVTAKNAKAASAPLADGENYFETPLGKFFAEIGLGLVQEFMQDDMLRIQKRRLAKGGRAAAAAAAAMAADSGMSIATLEKNLQVSRAKNQAYHLDKIHKCNLCSFKTESLLVLAHHREAPHVQGNRYLCNFCSMETREAAQALVHMLQGHGIRGRVEPHIFFHQCIFCPFEDHLKTKVTRHVFTCQKRFRPERNMEPPPDWEPPAKIPRMPNRAQKGLHGMGGAFNALGSFLPFGIPGKHTHLPSMIHPLLGKQHLNNMSLPPLIPANGIPQVNSKSNRNNNFNTAAAAAAALAGMKLPSDKNSKGGAYRNSPLYLPSNYAVQGNIYQLMNSTGGVMPMLPNLPLLSKKAGSNAVSITPTPATLVSNLPHASSLSISGSTGGLMTATPMTSASSASKTGSRLPQQPSISITPLPRPSASSAGSSSGSSASASAKPSSNTTAAMSVRAVSGGDAATAAALGIKAGQPVQPGQKTNMVVCEICDSCIKDLEQLRNHMHWIHKVKIHPKMIHNRPPLNCQKCQFRFFTDQGLERHLLGSHGLVTSSMQESANKGQDGGRCPICGKVYQWKLLSHVAKDHGLTLKPAHLSYKCTVCTATFNMYKLFENHVYTAHSVVAKKVLDKKGGADGTSARADSNHSGSGKSLKINDEITIIPQPARGPSQTANSSASSSTVSVSVSVSSVNKGDDAEKACQGCGQNLDRHKRERDYCSACARKMRDPLREPSQEKDEDPGASTRRRRRERKGEAVDVIDLSGEEDGGANNVAVRVPLGKSEITITKVKASSSSITGGKHSGVQLIRLPEGVKSSAATPLHAGDVEMTVSVSKVSQRKRSANEEVASATGKRSRHD